MDSKRHKLLEILSKRVIDIELRNVKENAIGVSYEKICESLGCDRNELYKLSNILFDEKEVGGHNTYGVIGMYATSKGISSYTDKKYLRLRNSRRKNNIKDIISIIVPILSLTIALVTIWAKVDTINSKNEKELNEMRKEIEIQKRNLDNLKSKKTKN